MSNDNDTLSTSDADSSIQFDPKQVDAINLGCDLTKRVVLVEGPAGTGKTKILETIHARLKDAGHDTSLSAPTGKSAKRVYELTGITALTNHRLLEYTHPGDINPKTGKPEGFAYPRRDRENPLHYDVLLCDEAGMNNQEIMRNIFDALKAGACVRFFGDVRQLDPIEDDDWKDKDKKTISKFAEMLNDKRFPSVKLITVFRQKEGSGILDNLHKILRQSLPVNNDQWLNKFTDQPIKALESYIFDHFDDIPFNSIENQIIVPGNSKFIGTRKLNFILQTYYFDPKDDTEDNHIKIPRHNWEYGMYDTKGDAGGYIKLHVGDKVIYKANNLDLSVFNGESGIVKEFDNEYGEVIIDFGDREQAFPIMMIKINKYGKQQEYDPRKDIDLAYAITTHKSQGSQYDHVIYIMNKCDAWLLNNRNIYTACSRAKKFVYLITDQISMGRTIHRRD